MLIDSNILVYAINTISPKHKQAQMFLVENLGTLEIAHQNILESIRVLTHPKFPSPMKLDKALEAIESIMKGCRIIAPAYHTYGIAAELIKKHKLSSNQVFDAYLAATALSNDINIIATDNVKDFQKLKEVKIINPFIEN